jgi:hypothetical protein
MADGNIIYNGTLPGADGSIATKLHAEDIAIHRQRAIDLFQFLIEPTRELLQLNVNPSPTTCIVGLPNSHQVRVLHCMGVGASGIGAISPIDGKLLFLHGDGNKDIGPPSPLVLPSSLTERHDTICMTHAQFTTNLETGGAEFSWPLTARRFAHENGEVVPIMKLAPIPSFLVLDGLTQDINAAGLYERIQSLDNKEGEMFTHLSHFLLAVLTGHNLGDECPRLQLQDLFAPVPAQARLWAKACFSKTFPTLQPDPVPQAPQQPDMAALLAQVLALTNPQNANAAPNEGEEKKDDDLASELKMSTAEVGQILLMCGIENGNSEQLPDWIQKCASKGTSKAYRKVIIRKHIMNHSFYEDSDVPLTTPLLNMVESRNWLGNEANVECPSYVNAGEGISPFMVLDLNEDEVAALNADFEAIAEATSVTASELRANSAKHKAKVPSSSEEFGLMLKRYANLLFALFGADCPLFLCVKRLITAFFKFTRSARDNMSQATRASILWVILKQSRKFAMGDVDVLHEFRGLHDSLTYKTVGFLHAETPTALYVDDSKGSNKRKKSEPKDKDKVPDKDMSKRSKPTVIDNPNTWHPKVKEALQPPIRAAGNPGFVKIMAFCNTNPEDLYSFFGGRCIPNCFFGRCFRNKECPRDHALPTEEQIKKIMEVTKPFRDNPTGLLQGQSTLN